jgi:PIN like domain
MWTSVVNAESTSRSTGLTAIVRCPAAQAAAAMCQDRVCLTSLGGQGVRPLVRVNDGAGEIHGEIAYLLGARLGCACVDQRSWCIEMNHDNQSGQSADSSSARTGNPELFKDNDGGIFDGGLDTYMTVNEKDYRSLFTSGLVVLDANTLLNLYRYQADTRHVLLDVLTRLKDRLWVPHQAMLEFLQNRLSVIESRSEEAGQAIEDLHKKRQTLEDVVRQWANRVGLSKDYTDRLTNTIRATVDDVAGKISEHASDDSLVQAEDTANDPVIASLTPILQGVVSGPLPDDELVAAKKEARRRIADQLPPGWRDARKRENPEGDYLIWFETLREAKRRETDVLLVTGDVKEDWWWRQKGEAKGPLPELANEMREVAGVRLFMLRPESFLVNAGNIFDINVSNATVKDAERVTTDLRHGYNYVEENTGRRYRRTDLTGPGFRASLSYEWRGVRPPQGRHWAYSEDNMDRMYANGQIEFTNTGRPVRKRYLDEQSGPQPPQDSD